MTVRSPSSLVLPAALAIAVGVFLALAALVAIFVIVVVANRAEPDRSGRRTFSVYLFSVSFVTVFLALFGSVVVVDSLVQLIGGHGGGVVYGVVSGSSGSVHFTKTIHPVGDEVVRGVVAGGLITLIAIAVLVPHLRRGLQVAGADQRSGPSARVGQAYAAAVAFVTILIVVVALAVVIYHLFELAGPGTFQSSGGTPVVRSLLEVLYLGIAAGILFAVHVGFFPSDWRSGWLPGASNRPDRGGAPPGWTNPVMGEEGTGFAPATGLGWPSAPLATEWPGTEEPLKPAEPEPAEPPAEDVATEEAPPAAEAEEPAVASAEPEEPETEVAPPPPEA
ncbi:MAG TPA: hypothetical protein VK277_12995, partial [Acidimicrobiales bacterium]|nr:hypothetical protein [Acidimicrobiales bacterium]